MIKVVRGNPTPEELAAALAVVQARAARCGGAPGAAAAPAAWSAPARMAGTGCRAGGACLGADVLAGLTLPTRPFP